MRVSILCSFVVLAACAPATQTPSGPFEPTAPECLTAQRHCDALAECGDEESRKMNRTLFDYTDDADCLEAMKASVDAVCYQIDSSLEAGRIAVDRAQTTACHRTIEALSCEGYLTSLVSQPLACQGRPFVTGLVAVGDACTMDLDCVAGAVCSAQRVCASLPHRGEACVGTRCEAGLTCESGVCAGDTSCKDERTCAAREYCDQPGNDFEVSLTTPDLKGTCAPKVALGSTCDDFAACEGFCTIGAHRAPGCTYCAKTNGFSSQGYRNPGTCEVAKPAGAACTEPAECQSNNCDCPGLSCDSGGACK